MKRTAQLAARPASVSRKTVGGAVEQTPSGPQSPFAEEVTSPRSTASSSAQAKASRGGPPSRAASASSVAGPPRRARVIALGIGHAISVTTRPAPLLAVLACALAACGEAERGGESAADATSVTVRVTGAGADAVVASLECGGDRPCDERRLAALGAVLDQSDDASRVCTQVYGGPERAHVTGTLRGRAVDAEVQRNDGCGIADYDALFEALGRSPPLAP